MGSFRVAILDDYQDVARSIVDWTILGPDVTVQAFHDTLADTDALAGRLQPFDAVVAMRERTPFDKALIDRLPNLKLLVTTGRRNAAIDVAATTARGIVVSGTSTMSTPPVELTWGLILSLARHIPAEAHGMKNGQWQRTVGMDLKGRTLGILGLGRLGVEVARIGQAFGMQVIAWSQNLTADIAAEHGATHVGKNALFSRSDIVSVHLVLSARTRGIVGAEDLARMKPTAYLINTARGPIVDEAALMGALRNRTIAGAGLDVFDQEPLPATHPLRTLDNVVLTPHLGYVTEDNYRGMYSQALEDISAFRAGSPVRVLSST
jgi:phosphoglycerate dehydrogenase-like enzyme